MSREQFETHELITRTTAVQEAGPRSELRNAILDHYQGLVDGQGFAGPSMNLTKPTEFVDTTDINLQHAKRWGERKIDDADKLFERFVVHAVSLFPHVTAQAAMDAGVISGTFLVGHHFQTADAEEARNIFSSVIWLGATESAYGRARSESDRIKTPFYVVGEKKDQVLLVPATVDITGGPKGEGQSFLFNNLSKYDHTMNSIHPYSRGKYTFRKGFSNTFRYADRIMPNWERQDRLMSFPAMKPTDSIGTPETLTSQQVVNSRDSKTGLYRITAKTEGVSTEEMEHPFGLLQRDRIFEISAVDLEEWSVFNCLEALAQRFHKETEYADMLRAVAGQLPEYKPGSEPDATSLQLLGAKVLTGAQLSGRQRRN